MKGVGWGLACALAVSMAGCAQNQGLVPAPRTTVLKQDRQAAVARAQGVTVVVHGDAWEGTPRDLGRVVTPVKVTIQNSSTQRLHVQTRAFVLQGASGRVYQPVPPAAIDPTVRTTAVAPDYHFPALAVSPQMSLNFPVMPTLSGSTEGQQTLLSSELLVPVVQRSGNADLQNKALREGVLEPGEQVTGFLYFDLDRTERRVAFRAQLTEPREEMQVANVDVPFLVR